MKYQSFLKNSLLAFSLLSITLSCQEGTLADEITPVDVDMIAATTMANNYLNSMRGKTGTEKSITVLQFRDGKLVFGTSSDDIQGYEEVGEESITATVQPGEHVFWYAGGGLSDLDGIDFDESSMLKLVDAPDEINYDKMWMLTIPEDFDAEDGILKYDIVYQIRGSDGPPIRLDPKLKVQ